MSAEDASLDEWVALVRSASAPATPPAPPEPPPPPVSAVDQAATWVRRLVETRERAVRAPALEHASEYEAVARQHRDAVHAALDAAPAPVDAVDAALRAIERIVLAHPVAAQDAFAALVREGRAAAATPDGAATLERLRRHPLLHRARTLWESGTSRALVETPGDRLMPTQLVEIFATAAAAPELERALARRHAAPTEPPTAPERSEDTGRAVVEVLRLLRDALAQERGE